MREHPLAESTCRNIGEEPLSPCAEEDRAGNDVAEIAKCERHDGAETKRTGGALYLVCEDAGEAERRVRENIVDQAYEHCVYPEHLGVAGHEEGRYGRCAEYHLYDCENECGAESPFCAEHISDKDDRNHAAEGHASAERELDGTEHRQYRECRSQCDHHGADG